MENKRLSPLDLLKERLRTDQADVDNVKVAASLGDPLARALFPGEAPIDWSSYQGREQVFEYIDRQTCAFFSVACAERALPFFEKIYPSDTRPRESLKTAAGYLRKKPNEDYLGHAKEEAYKASRHADTQYVTEEQNFVDGLQSLPHLYENSLPPNLDLYENASNAAGAVFNAVIAVATLWDEEDSDEDRNERARSSANEASHDLIDIDKSNILWMKETLIKILLGI